MTTRDKVDIGTLEQQAKSGLYSDLSSLDYAFELPECVTDQKLRLLYESVVHRMRTEAAHLPMNTVQQLIIERIAKSYIVLIQWENDGWVKNGCQNIRQHQKYTECWIRLAAQFNVMLMRATPAAQRDAFLERIALVVAGVIQTLPDDNTKREILQKLMVAFKEEGLN